MNTAGMIINIAIILVLTAAIVFVLFKSGWVKRHIPVRRSGAIPPDFYVVEQRLQEIASYTVARSA